ncbi:MAG: CCA tRNA nucleotidyltransferase [Candidatus Bathyarchaeota archaeon]|nr:CCA tRNA nucleotidyltransferase [Candidatus Bathyarchaeota archaeon]
MSEEINLKFEAKIREICEKVLQKAAPDHVEREKTMVFSVRLVDALKNELLRDGLEADVQIEGSIAKDTWLAGEKDIDIFILLSPKKYGRDIFLKVLETAKRVSGGNYLESYAEHPYLEAYIDGFTVNFVPCFKVSNAKDAKSSVDRTPFHTSYVKSKLNDEIKGEIRLLKAFMHGIGVYGAEIKVGGFSGYLCELLTIYYSSFINVLKAASKWRVGEVIDIEGYYESPEEARKIFRDEPLVVVDPVDRGRNVASAVRTDRLSEFIMASRLFLKNPDIKFFYPEEPEAYPVEEVLQIIRSRGSALIFIKTRPIKAVPDVLWGQLFRSQRAIMKALKQSSFEVIRSDIWSDEKIGNIFLFELPTRFLPNIEKHIGPPIEKMIECERFLRKHLSSGEVLSGPRVEDNRLVVERRRRYVDAVTLLKERLKDGGRSLGVASLVSEAFLDSLEILVNDEIRDLYSIEKGFASFLTRYLIGRPRWLYLKCA